MILPSRPLTTGNKDLLTAQLEGNLSSTDKNLDSYFNFKLRLLI